MGAKENRYPTAPCEQLRAAYNACFNKWYLEKFLKGQWEKDDCVSEWDKYRACLLKHVEDKHLRIYLEGGVPNLDFLKDGSGFPVGEDGAPH